jgi:hypothetical protein
MYSYIHYFSDVPVDQVSAPRKLSYLHLTTLEEAEIIPGKHSDTRIKPLALTLTNGHGRYIAVTPERTLVSVGKYPLNI